MEYWIVIILAVAGLGFWLYSRKKNKPKEVTPMAALNMAVANMTAQGKVENRDYQVFIVSESEYKATSEEDFRNWIFAKFEDKSGELPTINGKGLYEFPYNGVDILLLIVAETGQPVINWKSGKVYEITITEEDIDHTAEIQAQINAVPDGTPEQPNIIRFPEGRFWTEGDLANNHRGTKGVFLIRNRHNLIIEGNNTTFYTKAPAVPYGSSIDKNTFSMRRHFWFILCSNIVVRNLRVEGSNTVLGAKIGSAPEFTPDFWKGGIDTGSFGNAPAYQTYWEQEHAFAIVDCQDFILEDCSVNGMWGDGAYVGADYPDPSRNIILRRLHLRNIGRQGIAAANNVDGLLIEEVDIDQGRRASIDFEPHTGVGYVLNATVKNCKLHATHVPIAALGMGKVDNIQILNNEFSGGSFIICRDSDKMNTKIRKNWVVRGNTRTNWFGSPMASMAFTMTENVLVENNVDLISSKQGRISVTFERCQGELILRNNDFKGANQVRVIDCEIINEGNTPEQIEVNV